MRLKRLMKMITGQSCLRIQGTRFRVAFNGTLSNIANFLLDAHAKFSSVGVVAVALHGCGWENSEPPLLPW
eukprot:5785919-Amphidinium_carterae.1